ncbi:MAG: hypothetical protein KIT18_06520 [Burkholderiales bacterium]|nr:hypothetical protein [Burkholderiales bacterium]
MGRLRAIAITSTKRSTILPQLPTVSEAGASGYEYVTWYGVFAPGSMSEGLTIQLSRAVADVVARADVREAMQKQRIDASASTIQDFTTLVRNEVIK